MRVEWLGWLGRRGVYNSFAIYTHIRTYIYIYKILEGGNWSRAGLGRRSAPPSDSPEHCLHLLFKISLNQPLRSSKYQ